jgi:L-ascorbate metabolism protein UlaG (beta-lactamase superfamily)
MTTLGCRTMIFAGILFFSGIAIAQDVSSPGDTATLLKTQVPEKEAVIWYVGHDSFAIKTRTHLLIFDYYLYGDPPATPSLANGFINPQEFKDLDVVVFVTHRDGDHYDKVIWEWKKTVKRITYVLGWEPAMPLEKYVHLQPRETRRIGNIEVTTVPATDSGEAFLIRVDGLVIYHSGDHVYWIPADRDYYFREIDFLAGKTDHVDLLFIDWSMGGARATIEEGLWYTVDKLGARTIFPMHMSSREGQVKQLIKDTSTEEKRSRIVGVEKRGEHFLYRGGKIVR